MNALESLAIRFDKVDSLRSLQAARRQGGLVVRQMVESGDLSNSVLIELSQQSHTPDPHLSEFTLTMLWQQFAYNCDPTVESIDTRQVRATKFWEKPDGKKKGKYIRKEHVAGYIGESNDQDDWKVIAENYAHVCRIVDTKSKPSKTDHPYKVYYLQYISDNPGLRYPEAEAAKAYWQLELCKNERSDLIANESGDRDAAIKAFIKRFKYRLK